MLRIMTDGATDMPPAWEKEYDIPMIPVNIIFGDKTYLQFVDLDNEGFYRLVDESGKIPKTSQPSPHQFVEFYKTIAQPGDEILSIHVTSKLSGTYASAVAAAEEVKDLFTVYPVDSRVGSAGVGLMCREARKMRRAGRSAQEIVQYLEGSPGARTDHPDPGQARLCPHERPRGHAAGGRGFRPERQADRGAAGRDAEHGRAGPHAQGRARAGHRNGREEFGSSPSIWRWCKHATRQSGQEPAGRSDEAFQLHGRHLDGTVRLGGGQPGAGHGWAGALSGGILSSMGASPERGRDGS